jgi:hypothetical protein
MKQLASLLAFAGFLAISAVAQQPAPLITISANGIERGSFVPRPTPYTQGGPAVQVYLFDQRNVRTADGLVITGFEFIGWTEGEATRVLVFALVPQKGAPNTYLPNGDADLLTRRDFATYRIGMDQEVAVAEMRGLGIEPMILAARTAPANQIR